MLSEKAAEWVWLDEQGGTSGGGAGGSPVVIGRGEIVIDPGARFALDVCGDVVALPQVAVWVAVGEGELGEIDVWPGREAEPGPDEVCGVCAPAGAPHWVKAGISDYIIQ